MLDRPYPVGVEQLGHEPGHRRAVLEDVGDTRGDADVVLDHLPGAVAVAHQIAAGDVGVDPARRADSVDGAREMRAGGHEPPGDQPLAHDLTGVVDVVDEVVQGTDPLGQAALDVPPFRTTQHPRHEIQREGPFVGGPTAPTGLEGDPLLHEDRIAPPASLDQALRSEPAELPNQRLGGRTGCPVGFEQLVQERRLGAVVVHRGVFTPELTAGVSLPWPARALDGWRKPGPSCSSAVASGPHWSGQRPCRSKYSRARSSASRSRSPAAPSL